MRKKKKGVSEVMGYLLLVSFAISISFIVYQGLKTYVPTEAIECPDGASIFVENAQCRLNAEGNYYLDLDMKNNGRYNLAGYFIHATDSSSQTVATKDLTLFLREIAPNLEGRGGVSKFSNAVLFDSSTTGNFVNVSERVSARFDNITFQIYSLDILPIRFQKEENRLRMVSCGNARVREKITCSS